MSINTSLNLVNGNTNLLNNLKEYFDKQINPLANAGQRFGISANGISYKSFCINDIFNNIYDSNKYIAEIKYVNSNDIKITLIDKDTYTPTDYGPYNVNALSQIVYLDKGTDIVNLLSYIINNIEEYQKDSILINEDGILTCILKGKYVQAEDDADGEIFYFQYNINTNRLIHFIDVKPYDGYINDKDGWYLLYKLDYDTDDNYNLSVHLFTIDEITNVINNTFECTSDLRGYLESIFKYSSPIFDDEPSSDLHISRPFSPFNYYYKDYDLLVSEQISNINNLNYINIFQIVLNTNNEEYPDIIHINNLVIHYNLEEDQEYFTIDKSIPNYNEIIGYLSHEDINDYLHVVMNINFIYIKLLKYYNKLVYNESASTLYQRIFISLFNEIRNTNKVSDINDRMYIPLDYNIHYICSDTNNLDIYYSSNIYVTLTNNSKFISENIKDIIVYYHPSCINHSIVYNFEFDYNKTYTDIITSLRIVKIYSLPYINKLNNWVINDIDTNINSINDVNNGIKTIFIYSDNDEFEILNINNLISDETSAVLNKFNCDKRSFTVNPKLFTNYSNYKINCDAWIPTINDENKQFFEQTLLISISSRDNFNNKDYENDYNLDYVYSLWVLTEKNNKLSFEYIKDLYTNNDYAYDPFNSTAFLQYINNETNKVCALLVPSQNYKQTTTNLNDNFWMVKRNKSANNYNADGYNNDYNAIIEYVGKLNKSGNNPEYGSTKFIQDLKEIQSTNVIYPKYTFNLETVTSVDEFKRLIIGLKNNYNLYEAIIVNGQTITSEETLQEYLEKTESIVTESQVNSYIIETAQVTKSNTYYNEYVFNINVPTLDLKELFIRNVNTLNRANIISISQDNKVYNGYIGTSFNDNNKNVLHISTSPININIGNDTLINANQFNKFNTYDTLSIDGFNTIKLSPANTGKVAIETNNVIKKYGRYTVSSNILIGTCKSLILCKFSDNYKDISSYEFNITQFDKNSIFMPIYGRYIDSGSNNYFKLLFNAININALVNTTFGFTNYEIQFNENTSNNSITTRIADNTYTLMLINNDDTFDESLLYSPPTFEYNEYIFNHIFNMYTYYDEDLKKNVVKFNFDNKDCSILSNSSNSGSDIDNIFNTVRNNIIENPNYINVPYPPEGIINDN